MIYDLLCNFKYEKVIYSHQWLQTFFDEQLPSPKEVSEKLLKHSFEVEEVRTAGDDAVYELDILPNRSTDCLAHYGIAKEIAAIFSLPIKKQYFQKQFSYNSAAKYIHTEKCNRYTVVKVENILLSETPVEIRTRLESIGQRCINPIVDLSNYILFDIGQPIHTFDAQKVSGQFGVRQAKTNEELVLLGGETVILQKSDVVITDASSDQSIALAGVKGGEEAKVDENTRDVYIEIATFDNVSVRRTMRRTGLISDAALRFSQGYPSEIIDYTTQGVAELFGRYGSITDSFDCRRVSLAQRHKVRVSTNEVNTLLGSSYTQEDITSALDRLGLTYKHDESKEHLIISVPIERPDIQNTYDLTEEVGRILGYDTVPSILPERKSLRLLWTRVCNIFFARQ